VLLVSAGVTLVASRGRHLAWPVFLVIGLIALYGSRAWPRQPGHEGHCFAL